MLFILCIYPTGNENMLMPDWESKVQMLYMEIFSTTDYGTFFALFFRIQSDLPGFFMQFVVVFNYEVSITFNYILLFHAWFFIQNLLL